MEKLRNLKEAVCSWENLLEAYREAAKGKRYREEIIRYSYRLEENLLELQEALRNETYRMGPYREFFVKYPKPRLVMAIGFRDRIVQHAIYRQINPYTDKRFCAHSYGCREGKGNLRAALKLLEWIRLYARKADAKDWGLIKDDISKYFYRVDHEKILDRYREITDDEWFLRLIGRIIDGGNIAFGLPPGRDVDLPRAQWLRDKGMPIGNLTSQETANMYLDRLDRFVKRVLRVKHYIRYMDDFILIVHKEDAERIQERITVFLREELLLELSGKSRILPILRGCEFVGYRVTPQGLRLRKKTTKHMKAALRQLEELVESGEVDAEKARSGATSYLGMLKKCNGEYMRRWIRENIKFMEGAA